MPDPTSAHPNGDSTAAAARAHSPASSWPTGRLLSAAARRVERSWDAYLERWQLSHASVPVLVVLTRGPLSQREIASQMHVTEQSLGRVLRGLEELGYVTRERPARDRRRRLVTLTDQGRQALVELDQAQEVEALIGDSLSAQETSQLRQLLIRMLAEPPGPGQPDGV